MNVGKTEMKLGEELNRGDGICKYLDDNSLLCKIYDTRPVLCNVDQSYELFFKSTISKKEFYELNYLACKQLKKRTGG